MAAPGRSGGAQAAGRAAGAGPAAHGSGSREAKQRAQFNAVATKVGHVLAQLKACQQECIEATQATVNPKGPGCIEVTVISAHGLRSADWAGNGMSEHSCRCEIVGKVSTKIETPRIDDTQEPRWNFTAEVSGYEPGDSLRFTVLATHPEWRTWVAVLGKADLP